MLEDTTSSRSTRRPRLADVPEPLLRIVVASLRAKFPPPGYNPAQLADEASRLELARKMAHQEVIEEIESALAGQAKRNRMEAP